MSITAIGLLLLDRGLSAAWKLCVFRLDLKRGALKVFV